MKKAAAHSIAIAHKEVVAKTYTTSMVVGTVWRVVLPTVAFTLLGFLADERFSSAPWLALLGLMIGFVCAGILVRQQLGRAPENE